MVGSASGPEAAGAPGPATGAGPSAHRLRALLSHAGVGNLRHVHGPDNEGFGVPDDDGDADDGPMRGWVPPDDRLWLHPSERAGGASAAPRPPTVTRTAPRSPWVAGGMTVCVVLAMVLAGMVVAAGIDDAHQDGTRTPITGVPTTEANLSRLTTTHEMVMMASSVQASTVALVVATATGTRVGTGTVAEAGGIVVALRRTVAGARSITAVEHDGSRQAATEVGSDTATGITVLRIDDDLPVADFTTGDPATGSLAVAMSDGVRGSGAPTPRLYAGTVLYAGVAGDAPATGFCETVIAAPLSTDDLGSPLVEPSGAVAGVLGSVSGTGAARTAAFLPAELVSEVTAQIVANGAVAHGDLGVSTVDPAAAGTDSSAAGALVADVVPGGSAAQAGVLPGDRIVGVDGGVVRSTAELDTRLYAEPPGTEVPVELVRSGRVVHTTATLADS